MFESTIPSRIDRLWLDYLERVGGSEFAATVFVWIVPVTLVLLAVDFTYNRYFRAYNSYPRDGKDILANVGVGLFHFSVAGASGAAMLALYTWLHEHRLLTIGNPWAQTLAAFFLSDLIYYWYHRAEHRVRLLWVNHVNHHSSAYYNLSLNLRMPLMTYVYRGLALSPIFLIGVSLEAFFTFAAIAAMWAVFVHNHTVRYLGAPLEWLLMTPRNHSVHHGSNGRYVDKNYGGFLVIWDRMFGTYEKEIEPVVYGLSHGKNLDTHNPIKIVFHEWLAWARDLSRARSVGEALGYTFMPPGWEPEDGSRGDRPTGGVAIRKVDG